MKGTRALRSLQRGAGSLILPLADLVREAQRVGTEPVATSMTAEIWKGIWLGDQALQLALKYPRSQTRLSEKAIFRFHRSVKLLRTVEHKNVIRLLGVKYKLDKSIEYARFEAAAHLTADLACSFVAFPWMKHGNIHRYVENHPQADRLKLVCEKRHYSVQWSLTLLQMLDVADGLTHLHQQAPPIVHRSVQPVRTHFLHIRPLT